MRELALGAASALLVATTVVGVTPAAADTNSWTDSVGDVADIGSDITRVKVKNNNKALAIRIEVADLTPKQNGGTQVWVDTKRNRPGPEFVMSGGTGLETDWNIWPARKWKVKSGSYPLVCPIDMQSNYAKDTVFWKVSPDCMGSYDEVRISAEAAIQSTDYSPRRHRFHPWTARG